MEVAHVARWALWIMPYLGLHTDVYCWQAGNSVTKLTLISGVYDVGTFMFFSATVTILFICSSSQHWGGWWQRLADVNWLSYCIYLVDYCIFCGRYSFVDVDLWYTDFRFMPFHICPSHRYSTCLTQPPYPQTSNLFLSMFLKRWSGISPLPVSLNV